MWTPTVLICYSFATVLGNTDLAAGMSNQHLYWLCTGAFWQSLFEKHSPTYYFLLWLLYCGKYLFIRYSYIEYIWVRAVKLALCVPLNMSCPEKKRPGSFATFALIDKLLAIGGLGSRSWLAGLQERDEWMPREHWHRPRLHVGPNCGNTKGERREREKVKCHHVYPSKYQGLQTEGSALPSGSMWNPMWSSASDELKCY